MKLLSIVKITSVSCHEVFVGHGPDSLFPGLSSSISPLSTSTEVHPSRSRTGTQVKGNGAAVVHPVSSWGCSYSLSANSVLWHGWHGALPRLCSGNEHHCPPSLSRCFSAPHRGFDLRGGGTRTPASEFLSCLFSWAGPEGLCPFLQHGNFSLILPCVISSLTHRKALYSHSPVILLICKEKGLEIRKPFFFFFLNEARFKTSLTVDSRKPDFKLRAEWWIPEHQRPIIKWPGSCRLTRN